MTKAAVRPGHRAPASADGGDARGSKRGFLIEFIRRPGEIGSVIPSSRHLARRMIDLAGVANAGVVVEFGAGTGPITGHIKAATRPGAKFFAIEINPKLAALLRKQHPGVTVHEGSAGDLEQFCAREGVKSPQEGGGIDAIVSGIPFASLPEGVQRSILGATRGMLKPGGKFVTFGYTFGLMTPAGQRFHRMLPEYFTSVERTSLVWRNVPPAFSVVCTR
jgi:phospholipid N-methyltransferase